MATPGGEPTPDTCRNALRRILDGALSRRVGLEDGVHYFQCQYCLLSRQTLPAMESDHDPDCPYVIAREALGVSWVPDAPLCARGHWHERPEDAADCADCRTYGAVDLR